MLIQHRYYFGTPSRRQRRRS